MMSTLARRGLLAALLATSAIAGCKCGNKTNSVGCSSDQECIDQSADHSTRWYCDKTQTPPSCSEAPRACDTAADCCPSQVCNQQGHFCADKFTPCTGPGSCPALGEVCQEIGVFPHGQGCTFLPCGPGGACATGTTCFNQFCVGEPPCAGGCGGGKVCVTETNYCSPPPNDPSCQRSCGSGQELVLSKPTNIFDTCTMPGTCECDTLPPLQAHDVARHSSMTGSGNNLYVSVYDGEHGDLVVHTFDKNNLVRPTKSEWLDGVPATGSIGGDPNGPRHGIKDPGPNVGQYTSIVASNSGDLYLSYYDVDNGDLKFIARYGGPSAPWSAPVTIDGSTARNGNPTDGDVGLYSSIALTSGSVPAIAYFRRGSYDPVSKTETGKTTGLLYAIATSAHPSTAADWTVLGKDVDSVDKPRKPCDDSCTAGQVCVLDNAQPKGDRCATQTSTPTACSSLKCASGQDCVNNVTIGSPPVCATPAPAQGLTDLPQGTGLMPSLKFMDDKPVIAYYDSIKKALKAVQGLGTAAAPDFTTPYVIDGADATGDARDSGRFPSLVIGSSGQTGGRIAISFPDLSSQQLLLYQSDTLTEHGAHVAAGAAGLIHVIDDGSHAGATPWQPQSFPGVQSSLAFTAGGKLAVAYQDATPVSLSLAFYDPGQNKTTGKSVVRATGASGFWPRILLDGNNVFISSATIRAATATMPANGLFVDTALVQ